MPGSIESVVQEMETELAQMSVVASETQARALVLSNPELFEFAELFVTLPDGERTNAIQSFIFGQFNLVQHQL